MLAIIIVWSAFLPFLFISKSYLNDACCLPVHYMFGRLKSLARSAKYSLTTNLRKFAVDLYLA